MNPGFVKFHMSIKDVADGTEPDDDAVKFDVVGDADEDSAMELDA